jgi:UPF0755 protein
MLGAGFAALAGLAALVVLALYFGPGPRAPAGPSTTVVLEHGAGISGIARRLEQAGVIRSRLAFIATAKLVAGPRLQAGEYAIRSGESMAGIIGDLKAGRVVRHFITIPEGWTSRMAADAVNAAAWLTGHAEPPPEGALLPDTYQTTRGEDRQKVIARMEAARDKLLAQLWAHRQPGLPLSTPEEAVILASLVEKETAVPAERARIAAVFENRLKAGMRLESDPTVIYAVSEGAPLGRALTIGDLASPSPYNTYQTAGLPPTPIANPGRAALAAVLDPPHTSELYFVANGAGGHVFASTYEEHERNVARWRQIEKARAAADAAGGAK